MRQVLKGLFFIVPLLAAGMALAQPALDFSVKHPGPDPLKGLPAGSKVISAFGERAAFSPDGRKVAFIGDYDAFEYDIATGTVRNLTAHLPHKTLLRIQYLADGNYLLTGFIRLSRFRSPTKEQWTHTRETGTELLFLSKQAGAPLVRLGVNLYEGFAQSRKTNKIAWSEVSPPTSRLELKPDSNVTSTMYTANVVVHGMSATLENRRAVGTVDVSHDCTWEAQDFLNNDTVVDGPCYMTNPAFLRREKGAPYLAGEKIVSVDTRTGKVTTWYTKSDMYAEVEGLYPDERYTMVECGPTLGGPLDLCRFDFTKGPEQTMVRLTFGQDYGPYKFSNPVVSGDGKWAAFMMSTNGDEAGEGYGIVLMPLSAP